MPLSDKTLQTVASPLDPWDKLNLRFPDKVYPNSIMEGSTWFLGLGSDEATLKVIDKERFLVSVDLPISFEGVLQDSSRVSSEVVSMVIAVGGSVLVNLRVSSMRQP